MKASIIFISIMYLLSLTCVFGDDVIKEINKGYERLMKSQPDKVDAHRNFISKWKDNYDELKSIYEKAVASSPNDPVLIYALGYVHAVAGYYDNAIELFKRSLELNPNLAMAHFSLGSMYLKKEEYKLAEIEFQKAIEIDDRFPLAYFNLGEVYRKLKQYELAKIAYMKALEQDPKWGLPHYGLGMIFLDSGDIKNAESEFQISVRYTPEIADAHFKLGQIYAMQDAGIDLISKEYREGQKYIGKDKESKQMEAEAFYELGKIFASQGKSGLAIQSYKNAININPNMASANFELGSEYLKMGLKERAMEHYKVAIESNPAYREYFISQAKSYYDSGDIDNAKASFENLLTLLPDDAEVKFYYALIQSHLGNSSDAIRYLQDSIRQNPDFAKAYIPLGDLYFASGKFEEAKSTYRKALELDKSLSQYFIQRGTSAMESAESAKMGNDIKLYESKLKEAKIEIEKHLLLYPEDSDAHYKLGQVHYALGSKEQALKLYKRAMEISPFRYDIMIRVAEVHKEMGMPNESLDVLERVISSERADQDTKAKASKMSAEIYEKLGNVDKLVEALENAVRYDPSDANSYYKLGVLYEDNKGDIDKAILNYESAIKLDQTKADPYLRLGTLYMKKGMDEKLVAECYEKGLTIDPSHPQIQYDLAVLYKKSNNIDKAMEHYEMATKLAPDNYQWHYEYAKLLDGRDNNEAFKHYTRVIELKRDFAQAYYDRAMLMKKAKVAGGRVFRSEQIIEDLKQAAELDPKMASAYYNIAILYKEIEAIDMAREYFERTIKADPTYRGVHLQLGLIAEQKGEYSRAMEEYQKELAIDKSSALAYQRLGFLYSNDKQDLIKAEEFFKKSLELEPNNVDTLIHRANNLYTMGRFGESADEFEKVLQLDPKNPTANYNLALVYEAWGKTKLAIEQWQRFLKLDPPGSWAEEAKKHLRALGVKNVK